MSKKPADLNDLVNADDLALTDVAEEAVPTPPTGTVTLNMADLLALVRQMTGAGTMDAAAVAKISAEAAIAASQAVKEKWWNEAAFPHISAYNPLGERAHPRDDLDGEVFWAGSLLTKDTLLQEEIVLANQLTPGDYWVRTNADVDILVQVINLEPAGSPKRRLLVLFPCQTQDQRQDLPSMRKMLTQMLRGREAA